MQWQKPIKNKLYLMAALGVALALSGGTYAYTYTTAVGNITVAEPTGDIATYEALPGGPDWQAVIPIPGGGGGSGGAEILRPDAPGDDTDIQFQSPATGSTGTRSMRRRPMTSPPSSSPPPALIKGTCTISRPMMKAQGQSTRSPFTSALPAWTTKTARCRLMPGR